MYPDQVNERAARVVALLVALTALAGVLFGWLWIAPVLFLGFLLRAWSGSRFDPVARFAGWVALRLWEPKMVPGIPKRFAQILGMTLTLFASVLLLIGLSHFCVALLLLLFFFASLESLLGFCIGCKIFWLFVDRGWMPKEVCQRCAEWRP